MIQLLQHIVNFFVCWVETAIVTVLNLFIAGLAGIVGAAVAIMPSMPSVPSTPSWLATGADNVAYFFPVSFLVTTMGVVAAIWLVWIVVRIPLAWAKADPST